MIWNYFPIGLSYPVEDFSDETKRRCWELTLSALMAAEVENRNELWLFDFCAEGYPGSSDKEYVCILNQRHVTQTRVTMPLFKELDLLRPELSLHYPFYGANALDDFGPYIELGSISAEGAYSVTEEGKAILPEVLPEPMKKNTGKKVLIALNALKTEMGYSEALRSIGSKAAQKGMRIDYCPIADGGAGTAYAVTYAREGRFEWLKGRKIPAYFKNILLGIIPSHSVIWDCASLNAVEGQPDGADPFGDALKAIMDLGYRNIIFAIDGYREQGTVSSLLSEQSDPRLIDCKFTVLTSNMGLINGDVMTNGTVFALIRLGASLKYAPDYLAEELRLAKRGQEADLILLEQNPIPGVTDSYLNVLGEEKCRILASGLPDPEEAESFLQ